MSPYFHVLRQLVLATFIGAVFMGSALANDTVIRKNFAARQPTFPKIDEVSKAPLPGLWEVRVNYDKVEAPGVPADMLAKMKAQIAQGMTQRSCLTQAQVEKPGMEFFGAAPEANCTFEELNRSAAGVKVAMTCKPGGAMILKSKMDGKFAAESYTMTIEQSTEGTPMGVVKMNGKIEGKRIGDCPA